MNLNKIKMKNITAIACALFLTGGLFAQDNLVDNGSFEQSVGRVKRMGSISQCEGWASATGVKADYFLPTKEPGINTPDNLYGFEEPMDGDAYAGIVAFSYGDKIPRSYITTRLNETLKKGKKYCAQYNVSLAEGSKYAVNQMGMLFSKKQFESDSKANLIENPQVKTDEIYNAQFGWYSVCGVFIAEGGEKYLTLGNFNSSQDIKNEKNKPLKGSKIKAEAIVAAYYYIDDVTVYEMDEDTPCECNSNVEEEDYSTLIYQKQINVDESKSTPKQIVEAQQIFFGFGQDELTTQSKLSLDAIAKVMIANPLVRLQINGYFDVMEDEVGAEKAEYSGMDRKRVNAVMEYLKAKSVASARLIESNQGSDIDYAEIVESDDEEVKQAKNRRVEFILR